MLLCGHAFCRSCLRHSLAVSQACPMCRASCFLRAGDATPSFLLSAVIASLYGEELAARLPEVASDEAELDAQRLGLFFLSGVGGLLPHTPLSLVVYEPRYLLLMQRCMNNAVLFGAQEGASARRGCAMRIESVQQLPRGRLLVAATAISRYTLTEAPAEEEGAYGLCYAPVRLLSDAPLEAAAGPRSVPLLLREAPGAAGGEAAGAAVAGAGEEAVGGAIRLSARSLALLRSAPSDAAAASLLRSALAAASVRLLSSLSAGELRALTGSVGPPPPSGGPAGGAERWSFFATAILALPPAARARAAATASTLERLLLCYAFLEGAALRAEGARAGGAGRARGGEAGPGAGAAEAPPPPPPPPPSLRPEELDPCEAVAASEALEMLAGGGGGLPRGPLGELITAALRALRSPLTHSLGMLVLLLAALIWAAGDNQRRWGGYREQL